MPVAEGDGAQLGVEQRVSDKLGFYLEKVAVVFPDVTWDRAKLITRGWEHDVVTLDDSLAFRFPKREEARDRLPRLVRLLRYLAPQLTVAVPDYSYLSPDASFVGYEFLPGEPLWKNRTLPESGLAGFLTELHAIPTDTARRFDVEDRDAAFAAMARKAQSEVADSGPSQLEQGFTSFADELKRAGQHDVPVLLHGDLAPPNILSDGGGTITGIIDFDGAGIGDPALDFQGVWKYGPKAVAGVYRAYRGPKDDDFLRRALCYRVQRAVIAWYAFRRHGASADFLRHQEREIGRWLQKEPDQWIDQALA